MPTFHHVNPGDPLNIPASTFNAMLDAARAHAEQGNGAIGQGAGRLLPAGQVWVKNTTGADVDRFHVMGIGDPIFTPDDSADEFKRQVAIEGVAVTDEHVERFVIAVEPISDGAVGRGLITGVTVALVDKSSDGDTHAGAADSQTKLAGGYEGSAVILWSESGTGEKLALVSFGQGLGRITAKITAVADDYVTAQRVDGSGSAIGSTFEAGKPLPTGGDDLAVDDLVVVERMQYAGTTGSGSQDLRWVILAGGGGSGLPPGGVLYQVLTIGTDGPEWGYVRATDDLV